MTTDPGTGVRFFAGPRDDPSFFDFPAELAYLASRFANATNPSVFASGTDSFAGRSINLVALRVPKPLLTPTNRGTPPLPTIRMMAQTRRISPTSGPLQNVDRLGLPAVTKLFIGTRPGDPSSATGCLGPDPNETGVARRDRYNRSEPTNDAGGDFSADFVPTLQCLRANNQTVAFFLKSVLSCGDFLSLGLSVPDTGLGIGDFDGPGLAGPLTSVCTSNPAPAFAASGGGRPPGEDVTDIMLTWLNNSMPVSPPCGCAINPASFCVDRVDKNDVDFLPTFPFFAPPHLTDLTLAMSESADPVTAGDLLIYSLRASNAGSTTARGVLVANALPAEVVYDDAASDPRCSETSPGSRVVSCALGALPAGINADFLVATRAIAAGDQVTNAATAAAVEYDLNGAAASQQTTIRPAAAPPPPPGPPAVVPPPPPSRSCRGRRATIVATGGKTTRGTRRADVIVGTRGADVIDGNGGNDLICVGGGNDRVRGGGGNDRIFGEAGNDQLKGDAGDDQLDGGTGNDTIDERGRARGRNTVTGGTGNDRVLTVNGGRDHVNCGAGRRDRATVDRLDRVRGFEIR